MGNGNFYFLFVCLFPRFAARLMMIIDYDVWLILFACVCFCVGFSKLFYDFLRKVIRCDIKVIYLHEWINGFENWIFSFAMSIKMELKINFFNCSIQSQMAILSFEILQHFWFMIIERFLFQFKILQMETIFLIF
jgi:hypothetical protein